MKKLVCVLSLVFLLVMITNVMATKILWVSDCGTETAPHDQGFVDILKAEGYTVDRLATPQTMDQAKRDLANTYDLIMVGRHGSSGNYANNAAEVTFWNSITKPMICMNSYLWQSSRWKWINSATPTVMTDNVTAKVLNDPIFAGVTLNANNQVAVVNLSTAVFNITNAGNGVLIGARAVTGGEYVWIARWTTGLEYYVGSGQFAGGPRLAFSAGQSGGTGDGVYNLTAQGQIMFLNAVYQMSGATYDRKPVADAGNNLIVYKGDTAQLNGTVYDPENAATAVWTKVSGPGTVAFSSTSIANPTATFSVKGAYVLQLKVTDTANTVIDTTTAYVKDHADDMMVAHWDFEGLPDPNTLIDVTGHGFNGVFKDSGLITEPNMVAGHITGSSKAVAFDTKAYWEITSGYGNTDPNFNNLATGATFAVWVKISAETENANPVIIGNGVDGWRFQVSANRWNFAYQPGGIDFFGTYPPIDGFWHHAVAVYDGVNAKARIYVDGVLNVEVNVTPGILLSKGTTWPQVMIGNRGDAFRRWPGQMDDIAIYNYALSADAIANLAKAGDRLLYITAGVDQTVQYKGVPVAMDATLIINDNLPVPTTLKWTAVSGPLGADLNKVVFSNSTIEDPTATFPTVAGTYTLRLTADDTVKAVSDDVAVVIMIPTCANILAEGYGFKTDLSGPAGVPDCYVNLYDFARFAADWLRCNDPVNGACEWPY